MNMYMYVQGYEAIPSKQVNHTQADIVYDAYYRISDYNIIWTTEAPVIEASSLEN